MPHKNPPVTSIILAGGKSSRLGFDKVEIKLDGAQTILEALVQRLKLLSAEVIIVSGAVQQVPPGSRVVPDVELGQGSMRGLYSGLAAAGTEHSLVVACDMPFLNTRLLTYMFEKPRNFDVLVPRLHAPQRGLIVQPLHAIYSRRCIEAIEKKAASGSLTIREIYPLVETQYMDENEINPIDPRHLSFFNINTPHDLAYATFLSGKGPRPGDGDISNKRP